jgi:spore germination cell wall hydrolase CwlJ-like protein
MKRIVTVIVVWVTLCLLLGVKAQAATISAATKDNSQATIDQLTRLEMHKYSKSYVKKAKKKKAKKSVKAVLKDSSCENLGNGIGILEEPQISVDNMEKMAGMKSTEAVEQKKKAAGNKKTYTKQELRLMTCIIYCEARGESYAGQKAVGIVVMNRKRSKEFPDGIKKVIYQRGQFSPVRSGSFDRALALYDKYDKAGKFKNEMPSCMKAAKEVLEGSTTIMVGGKEKEMKNYLYFSCYISNAKYTLGGHQFK